MMRVAILAPFDTIALKGILPDSAVNDPAFPAGMGGYCVGNLVRARWMKGLPTDVITLDTSIKVPIMRWDGGLVRLWVVRRRARGAARDAFRSECQLLHQAIRESKPDVCHANWTYEYGLAGVTQRDYPVVLTVHDHAWNCVRLLGIRYWPLFLITQYVQRRAKHVSAVSPYVAAYMRKKLGRDVPVIPNVLPQIAPEPDAARLKSQSSPSSAGDRRIVSIVSAINWSKLKNTRRALEAFSIARARCLENRIDLNYALIGVGLGRGGPAESWARRRGCAEGVTFRGNVAYEDSLRMIGASNVLFHPSLEEAMPGPVAEAMAMRVPVVACREAHGSEWLLDGGRCGMLASGRSALEMAEVLCDAVVGTGPHVASCELAYARIHDLCNADSILEMYDRIYRNACDAHLDAGSRNVEPCSE